MLVGCCFVCSWDERSVDAYVMFLSLLMLKKCARMIVTIIMQTYKHDVIMGACVIVTHVMNNVLAMDTSRMYG